MAEILGLASGVIAVVDMTTKVGGASIKLKRLWDEVNEVPSVLLQKAELVQGLDELFDQAERQLATQTLPALYNNKILLQKSTTKARSILAELQVMIDGLLEQSTVGRRYKRKIGSTKVVLRKSEIKSLDAKLDEALTHFQMAQSLYTMATLMHNPILAIETQSKNSNESDEHQNTSVSSRAYSDSGDENTDDKVVFTTSEPQGNFPVSASRTGVGRARLTLGSCGGFQFFLRTPDWLSSSVYAVIASKSITGWSLHLRAYEVVPNFFAIGLIDHFRNDDAMAIFKCLDEQNLTPFVRDMDDKGLLQLACEYSSINFIGLLLKRGTKLSISARNMGYHPKSTQWLWYLLLQGFEVYPSLNRHSPFPGQKMLQLLKSHDVDEKAFDSPGQLWVGGGVPSNVPSNLMGDEYHCIPVKDRLKDARCAWAVVDFESFLLWFPELKHDPCRLLRTSREPKIFSFIHTIASHLPLAIDKLPHNHHLPITSHPWFEPFCKYIAADPEGIMHVENLARERRTPLSVVILHILKTRMQHIQKPIQLWITALFSCGTQLLNYGRNEQALCRRRDVTYSRRCFQLPRKSKLKGLNFTLIGITYGPRPEHWKLWWAFEYEIFAGDFWRMVEQPCIEDPELKVPGSWVEEPMDSVLVEWERSREWKNEELPLLIWSEYRKIRPPM